MVISRIADLSPGRTDWTIIVKVLSTWKTHDFFEKRVMLLVDKEGQTIEATLIHDPRLKNVPRYIYDGEWYKIDKFKVIYPTLRERNTTHPYQIRIIQESEMITLADEGEGDFYRFKDFLDIKNGRSLNGSSFDVCGCIIDVEHKPNDSSANGYDEVLFTLINGRNDKLMCCAKGLYADYFMYSWRLKGCHLTYKTDPVFCVLRFWNVGVIGGKPCIVNRTGSSRIFIKPNFAGLENHKTNSEFAASYYIRNLMGQNDEANQTFA